MSRTTSEAVACGSEVPYRGQSPVSGKDRVVDNSLTWIQMSAFITSRVTLAHPFTSLGLSFLSCKVETLHTAPGPWAQHAPVTASFPVISAVACSANNS